MKHLFLLLALSAPTFAQTFDHATLTWSGSTPSGATPASPVAWTGIETLYGGDVTLDALHTLDKNTGATTLIGSLGTPIAAGMAYDAVSDELYASDTFNSDLVRIDPATGATTPVGNMGLVRPHGLTFHPQTGILYVVEDTLSDSLLYTVNPATASLTLVGSLGVPHIGALDVDPTTGVLYGAYAWSDMSGSLYTIDTATGAATLVGPTHRMNGLAFDSAGSLFGTDNGLSGGVPTLFYSIDKATGAWVVIGSTNQDNILGLTSGRDLSVGQSYCSPAAPNSSGSPAILTLTGSVVVADNNVTLTASGLPANQVGYFLTGQAQGFFNPPGSQGFICLMGNIGRYNAVPDIIQGPMGSLALDLTAMPVNPPTAVQPGDTWNFQCWYRDVNPGPTSNFTDAVSVTFQ